MAATETPTCLELKEILVAFSGKPFLMDISLRVQDREIVSVIGPNGVGKTTLFNVICGLIRPSGGTVAYRGRDITGWLPDRICRAGVARTFQVPRPFPEMTVEENVVMGVWFGKGRKEGREKRGEEASSLLKLVGLSHKAGLPAKELTISELRRLEVARALGTGPHLLLLDEIAAGLSPQAIEEAVDLIRALRDRGLTIIIIDHFVNLTAQVSDRLVALCDGRIAAQGTPLEVLGSPEVIRAYLGKRVE